MNILYCVSSAGLGHVYRSLSIATQIRKLRKDAQISWLCAQPSLSFFEEFNENISEVSYELESISKPLECMVQEGKMHFNIKAIKEGIETLFKNYSKVLHAINEGDFDLIICDEFWEIFFGLRKRRYKVPVVFITDVVKFKRGISSWDFLFLPFVNWILRKELEAFDTKIFVGDNIPKEKWFGIFGEDVRDWARKRFTFAGSILAFDPRTFSDKKQLKKELGYKASEKLVIGTIGGTSIGKDLLEILGAAYPMLGKAQNLRMLLVCGPRLDPSELDAPEEVEKLGYVHELYKHFAVADCVVAQAGLGTLTELVALNTPAVVVPIKGHFEQLELAERYKNEENITVLDRDDLTPERLSNLVIDKLENPIKMQRNFKNGAELAAKAILACSEKNR